MCETQTYVFLQHREKNVNLTENEEGIEFCLSILFNILFGETHFLCVLPNLKTGSDFMIFSNAKTKSLTGKRFNFVSKRL